MRGATALGVAGTVSSDGLVARSLQPDRPILMGASRCFVVITERRRNSRLRARPQRR